MDEEARKYWDAKWAEAQKTFPFGGPKEAVQLISPDGSLFAVSATDDGTLEIVKEV